MEPATRRPNVVMILTDDHASHAIGAYGSVVNRTPHIDALADGGALLENCFATNALCSPSRASILTGTYSHINGVTTLVTPIDASQPTFVSLLREAGYRTAIIGKWHMGEGTGHDPENFDYWDVLIDQGEYHNPRFLSRDGLRTVEGYATEVITDLALEWLDELDGEAPWCVLIYHKAPHRPWEPDEAHADLYSDPIPVPETFDDDLSGRSSSAKRAAMRVAEHLSKEDLKQDPPSGLSEEQEALWKYQRYMQDYLRCVASVDDNVGRVAEHLRRRGEFDDTVFMYASDQGFFLGDHGWFDKRFMYEESIRMPFVISYPRAVTAGLRLDSIVTNVDIAQTILEAAGVEDHPRMQGTSFWGQLTAGEESDRDGFYYRYWEHDDVFHKAPAHYGYRTDRYKLIFYYNDGLDLPGTGPFTYSPEWELFDLETDPHELRNLAHDPAYAGVRRDLEARMWREQERLADAPHPAQPRPAAIRTD
ncbi:sulfatase [Microbacterium sp. SSW1-59]|uniref:sulfatase family protein n=1 Tax=Microbacterium xanthum TaxID=3079794 RepID=UPI002AD349A6|nr:sulfatase [Microbacterium sp. SSW1-59]MDZ8200351.1 sulfatase [Microbacterium sp. SSW1-59]